MFLPPPTRRSLARTTGISVGLHALLVGLLIGAALHQRPLRVFNLPGTASGMHMEVLYLPGSQPHPAPKATVKPRVKAVIAPKRAPAPPPQVVPLPAPPPPPDLALASPAHDAPPSSAAPGEAPAGSDSFGSGDIQIAFTTYSPSPVPDLSLLPHGTQGDVVLDVTIDSAGRVAALQVLQALGYGIDSNVIRTVRTWTFRPATKDGIPIASVQELHFHFGPV